MAQDTTERKGIMESTIVRGNRVPRRSSELLAQRYMMPDASVNLAFRELCIIGMNDLANRLTPIAQKWWDKPWSGHDVGVWESALGTALATEGLSGRSKAGLRHVREVVKEWLDEYVIYELADYEDEKITAERPCW